MLATWRDRPNSDTHIMLSVGTSTEKAILLRGGGEPSFLLWRKSLNLAASLDWGKQGLLAGGGTRSTKFPSPLQRRTTIKEIPRVGWDEKTDRR